MPVHRSSINAEPRGLTAKVSSVGRRRSSKARAEIVQVTSLSAIPWLLHAFSTRIGGASKIYSGSRRVGELNLGFTESDDRANVATNRERFLKAVAGDPRFPMVTLHQIHSSIVRRVTISDTAENSLLSKADGLMTNEPGILLAIQTADCIPVLIADRRRRAVAAFHAGWRGTLKRIVEQGVGRMRLEFGSRPENLVAAIGPGIGPCCYRVGEEVVGEFESQFSYAGELFREVYDVDPIKEKYPLLFMTARAPGHGNYGPNVHLDLIEANRRQLLDAGVKASAISLASECTSCRIDRYFSYRAERGRTGRMFSAIGIRSQDG